MAFALKGVYYYNLQKKSPENSTLIKTLANRLVQMYAVEKARLEARRRGHSVVEQQLADGTIKLTIQIGVAREDY